MAEAVVEPPIGCTGVVATAWNRSRSPSPVGSDARAHTPTTRTDEIRTSPDGRRERSPTPGDRRDLETSHNPTSQCKGSDVAERQTQQESFTMDDDSETPPELEQLEHSSECAVCADAGRFRCSGCLAAVYCSSAHQLEHWPAHRRLCRPYSVAYHPRLGRHLVATRALRRGDLILRDRPLMVGPCPETEPLCLGCYRPLEPAPAAGHRCSRCGWPLCSPACEHSSQHSAECDVTARCPLGRLTADEGEDWYPCVAVLRLLQLKDVSPSDWPRLLELQSHDVERRGSEAYQLEQKLVVERVRNRFGQFQHSELLIHRICGIMETNAYEIRLPEINVQGVYPRAALFQHDCVPNTHRTFDEDLTLVVRAAVDVAEGEHLTSIYTDNLWGTWQRREHLLNSKHFLCECARCSDSTELGTHLSSLRCSLCPDGYIQPVDPLASDSDFTCSSCGALVPGAPVRGALDGLQAEVEAVEEEPTIADCERLIQIISSVLHPTHHLMLDLKYPLVHLYNTSEPLPPPLLDRKEQLCREILTVADVLTPGISRLQGIVLYELQQTLLQKARALLKRKKSKSPEVVNLFKEARQRLCEAISVLRWEPRVQPEGQLGLEAVEELTQLDSWLRKHVPAAAPGSETSAKGGDSREPGANGDERSENGDEKKRSDADAGQSGCTSAGADAGCEGASK